MMSSKLKYRGAFLSLYGLMVGLGITLCYSLGAGLYWRLVALIPPLLYLALFSGLVLVPESPLWLLGHRPHQARPALQWFRQTEDVEEEVEELRLTMENQSQALTTWQALRNLSRPDIWKPFLLIITNILFAQFSGPYIIVFYAVEIFQSTGVHLNNHLAAMLIASIAVLGGFVSIFLIQKFPRVRLNMAMMTVMAAALATMGLTVYLKTDYTAQSSVLDIIQVLAVTTVMFGYGAGQSGNPKRTKYLI